ncbi:MAG: TatD family hydrolase [Hyphomicrobiaceae bacterium]|nr:TatD family hydrolase [Hyphomicrobiaceae bacterium]
MTLVDHHCHLDFPDFASELDAVVARAEAAGVQYITTISTRIAKHDTYRGIAERYSNVFFSVGTHPHQAHEELDVPLSAIITKTQHPKCVAVGEAGLDYFYQKSPREAQAQGFRLHIAAARETGLPLEIHTRDADDDTIAILEDEMGKGAFKAVLHCFTGGQKLADRAVALGLYISASGVITYKKNEDLRAIFKTVPLDRLLVETDAPYLGPGPQRGKRNEPAFVAVTAATLAEIKGLSQDALALATTENFFRLYSKAVR